MKNIINDRIKQLEAYVTNLRMIITEVNREIIEDGFVPNEQQKLQIEYFAIQGRNALDNIKLLESKLLQL